MLTTNKYFDYLGLKLEQSDLKYKLSIQMYHAIQNKDNENDCSLRKAHRYVVIIKRPS